MSAHSPLRVGIVGAGLIGRKRAAALGESRLMVVADVDAKRAESLAATAGAAATTDWREAAGRDDVDAVIVATTNDFLAPVALAAIEAGKHVLVEKPAARSAAELAGVAEAAARSGVCVRVGFNHRFHPALMKARRIVDAGEVGPLMYIRARYGHGGRLGYEKEWRADPEVAGGGEMLDQGVHLVDLARWFLGDFVDVAGHVGTFFWNMRVEDNGFAILRTADGRTAMLHASCTEWKNLFSFEIFGRDGKLQIDGLGGSYGVESLTFYKMLPQMGPPETTRWEWPFEDRSWRLEWDYFAGCVAAGHKPEAGPEDALAALRVVERLYDLSRR